MSVGFVALHDPHAEHRGEFISRVQHAVEIIRPRSP